MIFFDVDGTLLDFKRSEYLGAMALYNEYMDEISSEGKAFYESWRQISDKYFHMYLAGKMTFAQQRVQRIREIFSLSGIVLSDAEAKARFDIYLNSYEASWKPFDDVIPCLKELSGYRLGIISNGDFEQQSMKLDRLGVKDYFEEIITSGEAGIAKPNIELFKIACGRANEPPENCCYVGDDLNTDILPCREAGMHGIWLNRVNEKASFPDITEIKALEDLKDIITSKKLK